MKHLRLVAGIGCIYCSLASLSLAQDTFAIEDISLLQAFQTFNSEVGPCWYIPAGTRDGEMPTIDLRINLTINGMLDGLPQIIDEDRYENDDAFRRAADSSHTSSEPLRNRYPPRI